MSDEKTPAEGESEEEVVPAGRLSKLLLNMGIDVLEENRSEIVKVGGSIVSRAVRAVANGDIKLPRVGVGRPAEGRKAPKPATEPAEPEPEPPPAPKASPVEEAETSE